MRMGGVRILSNVVLQVVAALCICCLSVPAPASTLCGHVHNAFSQDAVRPERARPLLFGSVTYNEPQTRRFRMMVLKDHRLSCAVSMHIARLTRVARNPKMRRKVWHRMKRQEYLRLSGKQLARIEEIAASCHMSL